MKSLVRLSTAVTLRRQKEDVIQFSNKKFVGDPLFLMQKKKKNKRKVHNPTYSIFNSVIKYSQGFENVKGQKGFKKAPELP